MKGVSECLAALKKSNLSVTIPGFTAKEAGEAFCTVCRYDKSFDGNITKDLIQKTLTTRWPSISKSVLGGIQHIVAVDNGANYAELWAKGGNWYAVTGAELAKGDTKLQYFAISGVTKGMPLQEVAPRFVEAVFGPLNLSKSAPCPCNQK